MNPSQWGPRVWAFMALLLGLALASLGIFIWAILATVGEGLAAYFRPKERSYERLAFAQGEFHVPHDSAKRNLRRFLSVKSVWGAALESAFIRELRGQVGSVLKARS